MNKKLQTDETCLLFKCILSLETESECRAFFEDICTIHEFQTLAQRIDVARYLCEGKTYTDISEKTGASTATISRVNRALSYGSNGYTSILGKFGIKKNDTLKSPERSGGNI